MATCEVCGNAYDQSIEIVLRGQRHRFDCFECAVYALAPACDHRGCRIIGHGVEAEARLFCCAHCARSGGVEGIHDRP